MQSYGTPLRYDPPPAIRATKLAGQLLLAHGWPGRQPQKEGWLVD
jgi:hypothetical protein